MLCDSNKLELFLFLRHHCGAFLTWFENLSWLNQNATNCKITKPIGHLYNTKGLLALIDYPLKEYE